MILFILSIPLFVALPISDNFDTMANWRILLVILFLIWFFKNGTNCQTDEKIIQILQILVALFLACRGFIFNCGNKYRRWH